MQSTTIVMAMGSRPGISPQCLALVLARIESAITRHSNVLQIRNNYLDVTGGHVYNYCDRLRNILIMSSSIIMDVVFCNSATYNGDNRQDSESVRRGIPPGFMNKVAV